MAGNAASDNRGERGLSPGIVRGEFASHSCGKRIQLPHGRMPVEIASALTAMMNGRRPASLAGLSSGARIHCLGVCGILMSQLAAVLVQRGFRVTGSDHLYREPAAAVLRGAGISVLSGYSKTHLDPAPELVVIGAGAGPMNSELQAVAALGIPFTTAPILVHELLIGTKKLGIVCGTHGKSTTAAMLVHICRSAGLDPSACVGAVSQNGALGLAPGGGEWALVEGDEYRETAFSERPKFLSWNPSLVVLQRVELDHSDQFSGLEEVEQAFCALLTRVPTEGTIVGDGDCAFTTRVTDISAGHLVRFGASEVCDFQIVGREPLGEAQSLSLRTPQGEIVRAVLPVFGVANARNAAAAVAAAAVLGLPPAAALQSLTGFVPLKLRQEVVARGPRGTVIDDFAHHPTAVAETLRAVREAFPVSSLRSIFGFSTPAAADHRFASAYLEAFSGCERLLLIRPAAGLRAKKVQQLDVDTLAAELTRRSVKVEVAAEERSALVLAERLAERDAVIVHFTRYAQSELTAALATACTEFHGGE